MSEFDEIEFGDGSTLADESEETTDDQQPPKEDPKPPKDATLVDEDDDEEDGDEEEEKPKDAPKQYQDAPEEVEKAKADGWCPYDEWVEKGNPPGEWKTAKHFNEVGQLYNNQRKANKDHQREIESTRLLMEARIRDAQEKGEKLQNDMKSAVESGDWEEVQRLTQAQQQNSAEQWLMQNHVQQQQQQPQQEMLQKEIDWEKKNDWFNVQDPTNPNYGKSIFVAQTYQQLMNQGVDFDTAIKQAESQAEARFPTGNPNRDRQGMTDSKGSQRRGSEAKSFDELPADAKQEWQKFGQDMFGSKKEFVRAWNNLNKKG